jgi:hypothetical protein
VMNVKLYYHRGRRIDFHRAIVSSVHQIVYVSILAALLLTRQKNDYPQRIDAMWFRI